MKKIISLVLSFVMLISMLAVSSGAQVYVDADFSNMENFTTHFHSGLYYSDDEGSIYGYKDALCLQTVGEWIEYDTTIDVVFEEDDMATGDRSYSVWYCNINPDTYGVYDGGAYIHFGYSITNRECYITAPDYDTGESIDLMERVPMELEDGETYTFGMSVTNKRVRCFIDNELIFDYIDSDNTYLIGKQDELTESTAIVYWNENNFVRIKDVKITSPGYLFPIEAETEPDNTTTQPPVTDVGDSNGTDTSAPPASDGDIGADNNTNSNTDNSSTDEGKADAGNTNADNTDNENANAGNVDSGNTNSGNTNAGNTNSGNTNNGNQNAGNTNSGNNAQNKPADTNNNKPAGGNATATGDAAFVAVAVMVATLGCAVIVKKVSVR